MKWQLINAGLWWQMFSGKEDAYFLWSNCTYVSAIIHVLMSVCKEPPYKVEESGYAGFLMPIEVYFKNKVRYLSPQLSCILFLVSCICIQPCFWLIPVCACLFLSHLLWKPPRWERVGTVLHANWNDSPYELYSGWYNAKQLQSYFPDHPQPDKLVICNRISRILFLKTSHIKRFLSRFQQIHISLRREKWWKERERKRER